MKEQTVNLSIVIVNWNSARFTLAAIESVVATTQGLDYEIIVLDNASTDDSNQLLTRPLPRTTVIRSQTNLGFARGNNVAVRQAQGNVLLFLNPDTQVLHGAVRRLIAAMESSPQIGAVGARLLNGDGTLQTSCVQRFPTILNQILDAQWLRHRMPTLRLWDMTALFAHQQAGPVAVDAVSGACVMLRRDVFEQVGGFSEDYFLYAEDIDLCHKVWRAGWRVCHVPGAMLIHYGAGSSGQQQRDGSAAVLMQESVSRFLRKTRGAAYAMRYRRAIQAAALVRIVLLSLAMALPLSRDGLRSSLRKWHRILRWSRGAEPWVEGLGSPRTEHLPG